jgi:hypothetical protein
MPVKECKSCGALNHVRCLNCKECGSVYKKKESEAPISKDDDTFPANAGGIPPSPPIVPEKLSVANCPDYVERKVNLGTQSYSLSKNLHILVLQLARELDRLGLVVLEQSLARTGRTVKLSRDVEGTYTCLVRRALGLDEEVPSVEIVTPHEITDTILAFSAEGKATHKEVLAPWDDSEVAETDEDVFA